MKQQLSSQITLIKGQILAYLPSIDNQSQTVQTSAQIVRKRKYAAITLSAGYASHSKQKKMCAPHHILQLQG